MKQSSIKILTCTVALLLVLGASPEAFSQKLKPGPQDLTFFSSVDETNQPYSIYIPNNYDESKEYPLVIFLHGAMSNHHLGLRRAFGLGNIQGTNFTKPGFVHKESDLESSRYWPEMPDIDFIVAAPLARGTAGYKGIPEQDVYDMLADIKDRFNIDEDRTYLTGLSMGGGGTSWLGLSRPDIWAAIALCCPAPPDGAAELYCNAANLPVHLFVGDKDGLMPNSTTFKENFESIGAPVVDYIVYPGIGHNSWEYAYKDGYIFDWFSQFERDLFPEEVQFSTRWFKYNQAYWVKFDNLVPGTFTKINAKFVGDNKVEISTENLLAFSLKLAGHPQFNPDKKLTVTIDGKSFSLKSPDIFSFSKSNNAWANKKFTPGLTAKQKGAEGPAFAALSGNHVYVYGTQGNPSREELAARQAQAQEAANWMSSRGGYYYGPLIFPRVVSDASIRESDYDLCDLVLFGTKETNSVIAKYADQLPIELSNDAKDYGLVYIFPMNGKYVLVNSGLSWWTPKKDGSVQSAQFVGGKAGALPPNEDFLLFKTNYDNVISEGNFDNNWALPTDAANKMKASGVIILK